MSLLRKDALSMKLLRKPESSINICRESLYVIIVAFGYEKNNPARRAGEKNNLAPILSEKNFSVRTKIPSPPSEYQMDRALRKIIIQKFGYRYIRLQCTLFQMMFILFSDF